MRLPANLIIPILILAFGTPSDAQRSVTEAVADGGRLLSEGSYAEAARAFGEAIGMSLSSSSVHVAEERQSSTPTPISTTTNALRPICRSAGRMQRWMISTRYCVSIRHSLRQVVRRSKWPRANVPQAHLQKGRILAKEGQFEKAAEELRAYRQTKADAESEELVRMFCFDTGYR